MNSGHFKQPARGPSRFEAHHPVNDRLAAFRPGERFTAFRNNDLATSHDPIRWPFDVVDMAPGPPSCDLGTDCMCTRQMAQTCEWNELAKLAAPRPRHDMAGKFLIGSILLLAVYSFGIGYLWGAS